MKFAILSDTHFGDITGTLVSKVNSGKYINGPLYSNFVNAMGTGNEFLVMLGDILDFSIVSYQEAYEAAKHFFIQMLKDGIAKEIIYVPGNHDADIWHTVEYEVNVIDQMNKGKLPRKFRNSVPGIIDLRNSNGFTFTLAGVSERAGFGNPKYAGLFLDKITTPKLNPLPFNFAFPNVYLINGNEKILLTHGHYFEAYWSFLAEWSLKIIKEDLPIRKELDLSEMVGINFPLNQLASSGVGQAGALTVIINRLQQDIKNGNLDLFKKYIERLDNEIDKTVFDYSPYDPSEWGTDLLSNIVKKEVLKKLKNFNYAKFNYDFVYEESVRKRIENYIKMSKSEINKLNNEYGYDIPFPSKIIFGHTHEPISWNKENPPEILVDGTPIQLFNCGGWVTGFKDGQLIFPGAEIFIYDSDSGISSKRIQFPV